MKVIAGGGIAGLSALHYIKSNKKNTQVKLYEKENRVGGFTRSEILHKDNHELFYEHGPRSFMLSQKGNIVDLIDEIGLSENVILSNPMSKRRILLDRHSNLRKLPSSIGEVLSDGYTRKWLYYLGREVFVGKGTEEDETVYDFFERRFGKDIAEEIVGGMIIGIYGGDIKRLSVRSCLKLVWELEREYGSVAKGLLLKKNPSVERSELYKKIQQNSSTFSLSGGVGQLSERLMDLYGGDIQCNTEISKIMPGEKVRLQTVGGDDIEADDVLFTMPSHVLGDLFMEHDQELGDLLKGIAFIDMAIATFYYDKNVLNEEGFGYLAPAVAQEKILGVSFDSVTFPQMNRDSQNRLTVMLGGDTTNNTHSEYIKSLLDSEDNSTMQDIAKNALERHLGIKEDPIHVELNIYRNAIPQYYKGHAERIEKIQNILKERYPNILIGGQSYFGAGVNNCIESTHDIIKHWLD
eukprot:TRINITY_DN2038_c0_g1_i1.p1 TRINITY_DN2038_c0_g1~~TRINITY_DN2038_c0_g1_i1.p1  ORF type:complete len:484 (+),score=122.68 TRINITY_DN2038_c0_g1_i1:58-1452(+)